VIHALRSIVDPSELAEVVAAAYGFEVTECVLVRSLVNDVYRIRSAGGERIVKLYRTGHRTLDDVAWELELAGVLKGIVAGGVLLADGRPAGELIAAEGPRPFSMWEWAPGRKPVAPFDERLYQQFGAATAWFHAAADAAGTRPRRFDVEEAWGRPLDEVLARLEPADRTAVAMLIAAARERLSGLDLDRGICHGDVTLDNVHVDGDRVVLYDLDRAGTGWRAADLTGAASTPQWPAFLDGYRSVRSIGAVDLEVVPWLDAVRRIGDLHFHLVDKPAWRGEESLGEGWAEHNLERLRATAARLL
jgi:Ser/Thr protein kinase RdoA (MazF antagonist)